MVENINCYYWDPELKLDDLEFKYEPVNSDYQLKKPVFTPKIIETIIDNLVRKRKSYFNSVDIPHILDVIGEVSNKWNNLNYEKRNLALRILPDVTGFSVEMIEKIGFNNFLKIISKENIPLFGKLDPDQYRDFKELEGGYVKAYGSKKIIYSNPNPSVIGHICAGNIIGISAFEMILDKLVDAATWLKLPSENPVFGAMYAKSIAEVDIDLANTIAVFPFDSTNEQIKNALFSRSDLVRVTGGEQARIDLTNFSEKYKVPLAGHWHKLSFITISKEFLNNKADEIAELVSIDICAWDQQGCFSPQEIFVEKNGDISPLKFTELLAEEIEKTTAALPKGANSGKMQVLDVYHQYFKLELMGEPVKIFSSDKHDWLVIYDDRKTTFEPSSLFRVIRVKPIDNIMDIPNVVRPLGRFLQTVGVAIPNNRLTEFADKIGEIGATNIRAISSMTLQKPWEPWDGRFPVHELYENDNIRWVSINTKDIDEEIQAHLKIKRGIIK